MTVRRSLFVQFFYALILHRLQTTNYTDDISVYLSDDQRGAQGKRERERDRHGQRGVKRLTTAQFTNKGR